MSIYTNISSKFYVIISIYNLKKTKVNVTFTFKAFAILILHTKAF